MNPSRLAPSLVSIDFWNNLSNVATTELTPDQPPACGGTYSSGVCDDGAHGGSCPAAMSPLSVNLQARKEEEAAAKEEAAKEDAEAARAQEVVEEAAERASREAVAVAEVDKEAAAQRARDAAEVVAREASEARVREAEAAVAAAEAEAQRAAEEAERRKAAALAEKADGLLKAGHVANKQGDYAKAPTPPSRFPRCRPPVASPLPLSRSRART